MVLPPLTPEQRAAALDKAAKARQVRAEVKEQLRTGKTTLTEVLELGASDEAVGKLKVSALLEALPGVGKVTAASIMNEIGIADSRRVRGLGPKQLQALRERFS